MNKNMIFSTTETLPGKQIIENLGLLLAMSFKQNILDEILWQA